MQLAKVNSSIVDILFGIVIEVKPVQLVKAKLPILVTLFGIVIEVKPVQLLKAKLPIEVTLLGIVIVVNPLQYLYLQPIITQYFIDNKSEIWLLFLIAHSKR